ncbi:hypothetical protein, variant 1 [Aphanomyces astaci]|uniref:General transcription factor 3C polypeptide 3 n=1 Tax=Aphanomyces astaci TaxID=112090 RepID=W4HA19_APHAT|nr:hypothetical protein, variant 1 [Aphanomyces astaci]ETV88094.1 hypothetical protein, variant 1 [Aphanomyces astaci]|eukprot:XP_009822957.1 hypothetical protein, variant 1 [Aphanomyces astaci]
MNPVGLSDSQDTAAMSFQTLLATALSEDEEDVPSSGSMYEDGSESEEAYEDEEVEDKRAFSQKRKASTEDLDMENEDHSDLERQLWGKKRGIPRRRGRRRRVTNPVPPEYAELMGEANAAYISGDHAKAIAMLKDFVKKAPTVPDPYHTLGVIYEKLQDRAKAIQFFLIACSLTPTDAGLWRRVGRMAKDECNSDQALYCYKMATQADPKDVDTLYTYADMCKEGGDHRRAAEALKKVANLTPTDLSVWLQVAECYHANSQDDDAIDALLTCIQNAVTHPDDASQFELHAVNMVSDLYITLKRYQAAIHAIEAMHERSHPNTPLDEDSLPLDIAVKFGICHLHLGHLATAQPMFDALFHHEVDVYGDLYIDVAEAFIEAGQVHDRTAIDILQNVLLCPTFANDKVYAMMARAYHRQGVLDTALQFYDQALTYQSGGADGSRPDPELVWQAMCICRDTGATARGLGFFGFVHDAVLLPPIRPYWAAAPTTTTSSKADDDQDQDVPTDDDDDDDDDDEGGEEEDSTAVDEIGFSEHAMENGIRLKLFLLYGRMQWQSGEPNTMVKIALPLVLLSLQQTMRLLGRKSLLRRMHKYYDSKSLDARDLDRFNITHSHVLTAMKESYLVNPTDPTTRNSLVSVVMRVTEQVLVVHALSPDEYVGMVRDVAKALCDVGKHICAVELLIDVNCSNKIADSQLRFELRFLALTISLTHKENRMAYECVRLNILEEPMNVGYWNLFGHVINQTGVFSWHQKFLAKILRQYPKCYPAMVLAGLHSSASDSAQLAVGELTLAHLQRPEDPLALFCIGLSYLNMSMFRTVVDRQMTVAKAFAFFQLYQQTRFKQLEANAVGLTSDLGQVESWYNIGRAYHQLVRRMLV